MREQRGRGHGSRGGRAGSCGGPHAESSICVSVPGPRTQLRAGGQHRGSAPPAQPSWLPVQTGSKGVNCRASTPSRLGLLMFKCS